MEKIKRAYRRFMDSRKESGLLRALRPVSPLSAREIEANGKRYTNFSGNDYLGLSRHPALIKAAGAWAEQYGAGSTASRLVVGDFEPYQKVEEKIATFKGYEAALVMASGYQCNASVLPALFNKDALGEAPLVFADKLNHASMHAGCAAAGVKQIRYRHCDMQHLSELLEKHKNDAAPKFILSESVFSMDGDVAPMREIMALAEKHDACVICDDAHATGVLGEGGKGLSGNAHITIGTFSKGMGSFGAYVACAHDVKEYLINMCGGVIYSTALPPAVWGSIDVALDIVPTMQKEREKVQQNAAYLREMLQQNGVDTGDSATQIVPAIIGDAARTLALSAALQEAGIWATAIRPPTVPQGTARIRFAVSAAHERADIEKVSTAISTFLQQKAA